MDKPAKRQGKEPTLDLDPFSLHTELSCLRATLEFVVDTAGKVELWTMRTIASDHPTLTAAMRASAEQLKYAPAQKVDRRVRQVMLYSRSVAIPKLMAIKVGRVRSIHDAPLADESPPAIRSC